MKNGVGADRPHRQRHATATTRSAASRIQLGGEAVRVGQALGYHIEKIGKFDPDTLAERREGDKAALDEVEADPAAGSQPTRATSSARRWPRTSSRAAAPRSNS